MPFFKNSNILFMNLYKLALINVALLIPLSCVKAPPQNESALIKISTKVDALDRRIRTAITNYNWQLSLDHHRMAQKENAYTPPAIATIFSDPQINSKILQNNDQLIALDLPFKLLAYSVPDGDDAVLAYTSAELIASRHELPEVSLAEYSERLDSVLNSVDHSKILEVETEQIKKDFAIVKIKSDFDFETTTEKLKKTINALPDTILFGELDYQNDAEKFEIQLNPTLLLFFGAPEPGAKAMVSTPRLGLDAFCQKLLVFEDGEGEVWAAYNDIPAFSKLYYNTTTISQRLIKRRLKKTISNTLEEK